MGRDVLGAALPWRTMRWYHGQAHYSGLYWSSTTRQHVLYESRLELTRALFADFDPAVAGIIAQPFLLTASVDGADRKHIPDYLLLGEDQVAVVDVKPRRRLEIPEVAATFAWTRELVESRGWRYEVWSEPDPVLLANVRFLAGFRRWVNDDAHAALAGLNLDGARLGDVSNWCTAFPSPVVRATVLRMLWTHELEADLTTPLTERTELKTGAISR